MIVQAAQMSRITVTIQITLMTALIITMTQITLTTALIITMTAPIMMTVPIITMIHPRNNIRTTAVCFRPIRRETNYPQSSTYSLLKTPPYIQSRTLEEICRST